LLVSSLKKYSHEKFIHRAADRGHVFMQN